MELRHNDEPLGIVFAGGVEIHYDLCVAEARFWAGLRGLRSRIAFCRPALPGPGADIIPFVVR